MAFKNHGPGGCCCACAIDALSAETVIDDDVIRDAEHPQAPYPAWVQTQVKLSGGDAFKLFWAWDDSTPGDGFYAELYPQVGNTLGTLKLFRKDGAQLGDTLNVLCATTAYWHRLTACYDPDTGQVSVYFDAADERGYIVAAQAIVETVPADFVAGRQAGYGGAGTIRNYRFERLWYLGTGTEDRCCAPVVTETQQGLVPGLTTYFDLSAGPCDFNVQFAAPAGIPITFGLLASPWPPDASAIANGLNSYFGSLGLTFSGEVSGNTMTITQRPATPVVTAAVLSGCVTVSGTGTDVGSSAAYQLDFLTSSPKPCRFVLSFDGGSTATQEDVESAADLQAALEALPGIGAGNVMVSKAATSFYITFQGSLAYQPVASLTAAGAPDCLECSDYYGDNCTRIKCHPCVPCLVMDEDFQDLKDGDLPCPWEQGTAWSIVDEKATGDGPVELLWDFNSGTEQLEVEFAIGTLETEGDFVTVGISTADDWLLTITRVVVDSVTKFRCEFNVGSYEPFDLLTQPYKVVMSRCPDLACATLTRSSEGPVPPLGWPIEHGSYSVLRDHVSSTLSLTITQPTLSGHADTTVTHVVIKRTKEFDAECDPCCPSPNCPWCEDSEWPSEFLVQISGTETLVPWDPAKSKGIDCSAISRAYFLSQDTCGEDIYGNPWVNTCVSRLFVRVSKPDSGGAFMPEWLKAIDVRVDVRRGDDVGKLWTYYPFATGGVFDPCEDAFSGFDLVPGLIDDEDWYAVVQVVRYYGDVDWPAFTGWTGSDGDLWVIKLQDGVDHEAPDPLLKCLEIDGIATLAGQTDMSGRHCGTIPTGATCYVRSL